MNCRALDEIQHGHFKDMKKVQCFKSCLKAKKIAICFLEIRQKTGKLEESFKTRKAGGIL